jgi:nickel transport protein
MKSFVRWSATLGLIGSTLLGSVAIGNLPALALTEEQIAQKLGSVPVFTVTDGEGSPVVASVPNGDEQASAVAGVFISQEDAEAFVNRLKQENPELGNAVRVVPVPLAEVYKLDRESESQQSGLDFAYIPDQEQLESAQAIQQNFQGTPLFVARGGQEQGYLTIQQNGQQLIPFFFEKEQLENMVNRFKQQQPELASTVEMQVVPLEGVIQTLQNSDNEQLQNIVLIPSQESLEFLRSLPASSQ